MDVNPKVSNTMIAIFVVALLVTGLSCTLASAAMKPTGPAQSTSSPTPTRAATVSRPVVPTGWKLSQDATGACRVAAPSDWQLGRDFFLEAEQAVPGPIEGKPGQFPPLGAALWGGKDAAQAPAGKQYQIRTSLVIGDQVCSVWRIKPATDFTADEINLMKQVGQTLQEVH